MFEISKKAKEAIGLDVGNYSIKVTSVTREADKNVLTAYNLKKIPLGGKESAKTGKFIRETLDEVDIHQNEVNLSISGSNMIVRFFTLPKMGREQLENAMVFEAEKYIPFSVNEVIMDFIILDDAEPGQMNVLLAAAKKDLVQPKIDMLERLGIRINIVDVNAFAVFNAFTSFNSLKDDKGTVFLDLGYSQTNLLISSEGFPRFMRLIQIGGKDINSAIAGDMGITMEEAEEIKLKSEEKDKDRIDQSTFSVLDELVKETQLSFGYFENKYNKAIGDIFCSGGMVYQRGVISYLQEKLGVQLKLWNPVEKIQVSESLSREAIEPIASQLAVSIGLALRG